VSTFLPTQEQDPSSRFVAGDINLERPFYLIDTFDELARTDGLTLRSVDNFCHPDSLIRFGRPMWVTQTLESTIETARYKVVHSKAPSWTMKESLAVLGVRMLLDIAPRTEVASDLVGNHMRQCIFVSQARDFIWSVSPSEPVLVEAATQLMHETAAPAEPPLSCMLKRLAEALLTGLVEAGPRGELVARAILLLAADHACQKKGLPGQGFKYNRALTVREYLDSLVGTAKLQALSSGSGMDGDKLNRLLGASMFLTHIV
jgi:hypothetical protein